MNAAVSALVSGVLLGAVGAQELVAHRADFDAIRWKGVESFAPRDIYRALLITEDAAAQMHPSSSLESYLPWLEREIEAGYRWAGFGNVQVSALVEGTDRLLHVKVVEGSRTVAGPITVDTDSESLRSALLSTLRDQDRGIGWTEGGPARLGPRAKDRIRETAAACCQREGLLRAQVEVEVVDDGSPARLTIRVADTAPTRFGALALEGCSEELATAILSKIDHDPEQVASQPALQHLVGSLYETGRVARVRFPDPRAEGGMRVDPTILQVVPSSLASDPTPEERRDLELLRASAESIARRFGAGDHLFVEATVGSELEGTGLRIAPGRLRVAVDRTRMLMHFPPVRLGRLDLGEVYAELSRTDGFLLTSERLGDLVHLQAIGSGDWVTILDVSLEPLIPDPDQPIEETARFRWGFALKRRAPEEARVAGLPQMLRFDEQTWFRLWLAAPAVVDFLRQQERPEYDRARLRLLLPDDDLTLEIDRESQDPTLISESGFVEVRLAPGPATLAPTRTDATDPTAALEPLLRGGTGVELEDLVALVSGLLDETTSLTIDPDSWHDFGFTIPRPEVKGLSDAVDLIQNLGVLGASGYPATSWPHVLVNDSIGLFLLGSARAPRFTAELRRLKETDACGPLGWFAFAAVTGMLGAEDVATSCVRECRKTFRFEPFWSDLERLTVGSDLLDRIGARWRADAATKETDLARRIADCVHDRAAAKIGMDALWRTVLARALLDLLAEIERD